jgi:hypothetical protein
MEPVNHWRPVTDEYQQELPAFNPDLSPFREKFGWLAVGQAKKSVSRELPTGITCVSWFYLLAAGAYFVFGSVLLSSPASNLATLLISYFRVVVPLPAAVTEGMPLDSTLAEAFFVMAMVSATIGVMWLVRFRPVRLLTLCYSGGALIRCAYYFLDQKGAGHTALLTLQQSQLWLAMSAIDAMIFCYVAFYASVQRVFRDTE